MKRLITFDDRSYMPLWQADMKFIQDNLIQVLTWLGKTHAYNRDNYIVSGCQLTNDQDEYSVTEGLVMIDGELLHVPEQTIDAIGLTAPHIVKQEQLDPDGNKLFRVELSTEFRDTYDDNYGRLMAQENDDQLPNRLYLESAKTITDIIIEKVLEEIPDYMHRGLTEQFVNYNSSGGYTAHGSFNAVHVGKNAFGDVMITAAFTATNESGYICTLPEIFRPIADIAGTFYANDQVSLLKIRKDGKVAVKGSSTTGVNYISFQFNILHNDLVNFNLPYNDNPT